jgi:hypothetical protein
MIKVIPQPFMIPGINITGKCQRCTVHIQTRIIDTFYTSGLSVNEIISAYAE